MRDSSSTGRAPAFRQSVARPASAATVAGPVWEFMLTSIFANEPDDPRLLPYPYHPLKMKIRAQRPIDSAVA